MYLLVVVSLLELDRVPHGPDIHDSLPSPRHDRCLIDNSQSAHSREPRELCRKPSGSLLRLGKGFRNREELPLLTNEGRSPDSCLTCRCWGESRPIRAHPNVYSGGFRECPRRPVRTRNGLNPPRGRRFESRQPDNTMAVVTPDQTRVHPATGPSSTSLSARKLNPDWAHQRECALNHARRSLGQSPRVM
jgi:hypothetical protein